MHSNTTAFVAVRILAPMAPFHKCVVKIPWSSFSGCDAPDAMSLGSHISPQQISKTYCLQRCSGTPINPSIPVGVNQALGEPIFTTFLKYCDSAPEVIEHISLFSSG